MFRDIVILMRETGMRNERELYRVCIENIDWMNKLIFIPDGKTQSGRCNIPMSDRVMAISASGTGHRARSVECDAYDDDSVMLRHTTICAEPGTR